MKNEILKQKGAYLKVLSLVGKRIEKALQEELKEYSPTVCWQLLDDELTMQILIRIENGHSLFGRVIFSSDVSDEKAKEYSLLFYSSLPEGAFRYSEERLGEWSVVEVSVEDIVLRENERGALHGSTK